MASDTDKEEGVKVIKPRKRNQKSSKRSQAVITTSHAAVQVENTPDNLLAMAVQKGMGVAEIEKFMDLHERWLNRIAKQEFNQAMVKFQEMAPDLVKNKMASFDHKQGPGKTEYHFQELGDIAKHIRKPLADCGLSYNWKQKEEGKDIFVFCVVKHIGGHEEVGEPLKGEADVTGGKQHNIIQAKASTISYLKRYTLLAALGLSSSDPDNDGKGGAKIVVKEGDGMKKPAPTKDQFKKLLKDVKAGTTSVEDAQEYFQLDEDQVSALKVMVPQKPTV